MSLVRRHQLYTALVRRHQLYMALVQRHQLYMAPVQRHQLCMAFLRANLHGFSARDLGMCCATKVLHRPGWRRVAYEWLSPYRCVAPPRAWLY